MTSRERWLDEGLAMLAATGLSGVTIDALCERLQLSKGSFYHHFKGMPGYRKALLDHYEKRDTQAFIDLIDSLPMEDGAQRLRRLVREVVADADGTRGLESAVRSWAGHDSLARESVERIDRQRVDYLQRQCRTVTTDRRLADDVGQMIYLVMIGADHLLPPVGVRDQARLWGRLIASLEATPAATR